MKDLLEAIQIFSKYTEDDLINCTHDELHICVDESVISKEDIKRLEELSFEIDENIGGFYSFRFGSC